MAWARVATGALALRVQGFDLPLRDFQLRLRGIEGGALLDALGAVLLRVLHAAGARFRQVLIARGLLPGEGQRRLRLLYLRLVGVDLRLLHGDLRVDVLNAGLAAGDLRLRLVERGAVVTVVDAGDHGAGGHVLVVGDGDGGEVAGDFRGDGELPGGDEGVVGRLEVGGVVPVEIAGGGDEEDQHQAAHEEGRAAPAVTLFGLLRFVARLQDQGLRRARRRRRAAHLGGWAPRGRALEAILDVDVHDFRFPRRNN